MNVGTEEKHSIEPTSTILLVCLCVSVSLMKPPTLLSLLLASLSHIPDEWMDRKREWVDREKEGEI